MDDHLAGDGKRMKGTMAPLNFGVACNDGATGSGYLLYSAENVHTRFADNPPHVNNADHFICVKYISGAWNYDDNGAYHVFTPEEGDILVASINYDTDVITSLAGQNSTYYGIAKGYASGNLGYIADQFSGVTNDGEFTVTGTSFTPNKLVIARKYYSAGGSRVAMRQAGTLFYQLSDHLGSNAVVADEYGNRFSEVRYKAWGEDRYVYGTVPTTYKFTGQRQESSIGLYFYGARWYDAYLNRWIQPDTIIPDQCNSADWDRYSYTRNNPVRYSDPTGHLTRDEIQQMLGADNWEGILGMFENDGTFEGQWGLLEVLRQSEVGDRIVGWNAGPRSNRDRTTSEMLGTIRSGENGIYIENPGGEMMSMSSLGLDFDGYSSSRRGAGVIYGNGHSYNHFEFDTDKSITTIGLDVVGSLAGAVSVGKYSTLARNLGAGTSWLTAGYGAVTANYDYLTTTESHDLLDTSWASIGGICPGWCGVGFSVEVLFGDLFYYGP